MSRAGMATAALIAAVALGSAVLIMAARSMASGGTPSGILAGAPAAGPPPTVAAHPARCRLPGPAAGPRGLALGGACTGELASFDCIASSDDLYATGRVPLDREHILYLTINVESFPHRPGEYSGVQAVLQVTGPVTVERWSNYGVTLDVETDGSLALSMTALAADPGTGSGGTVTISGTANCTA